jgi:hypothetical protein
MRTVAILLDATRDATKKRQSCGLQSLIGIKAAAQRYLL